MKRHLIKMIAFILVGLGLFGVIQETLRMKGDYLYDAYLEHVHGYEVLEEHTVDALFLGDSTILYGISPMHIYEENGIISYNLGSGMQPLDVSYFTLKWALQTQRPKVVMVNASGLFSGHDNSGERIVDNREKQGRFDLCSPRVWLLDMLPPSALKLEMVNALMDLPIWGYNLLETIFPVIRYHSRWNDLSTEDFTWALRRPSYSMGMSSYLLSRVMPAEVDADRIESIIEEMKDRNEGTAKFYTEGRLDTEEIEIPLHELVISGEGVHYLTAIRDLCKDYGVKLALINVPSVQYPQSFQNIWCEESAALVNEVARELEIPFYDLSLEQDLVDFQTDTPDGGLHLNIRGVEKLSERLGQILCEDYHLNRGVNVTYEKMLPIYNRIRRAAMLETERDFDEYLQMLSDGKEDWTILIAAYNEYTGAMQPGEYTFLADRLHLKLIAEGGYTDSYVAVISGGEVVLEGVSNRKITRNLTVNGMDVQLLSAGWYSWSKASILIGGEEYAQDYAGLNIVVLDNATKQVIDSVAFDTQQLTKPCHRIGKDTDTYFRLYEQSLLS